MLGEFSAAAASILARDAWENGPGLPIDRLEALADGQKVPVAGFETTSAREAAAGELAQLPQFVWI